MKKNYEALPNYGEEAKLYNRPWMHQAMLESVTITCWLNIYTVVVERTYTASVPLHQFHYDRQPTITSGIYRPQLRKKEDKKDLKSRWSRNFPGNVAKKFPKLLLRPTARNVILEIAE